MARDHLEKQLHCTVLEGLLSPVADSFNKPNLASAHHRLAMVEAATSHSNWLRADGWECRQKSWSRTALVLRHHLQEARRKLQDDVRLVLVVGGDVVESFTRVLPSGENLWHPSDVREIITKFGLIVIRREGADPFRALQSISSLRDVIDQVIILADDICPCSISSTNIRTAVAAGKSIMFTTPFAVVDYIQKVGLYTSNNCFT